MLAARPQPSSAQPLPSPIKDARCSPTTAVRSATFITHHGPSPAAKPYQVLSASQSARPAAPPPPPTPRTHPSAIQATPRPGTGLPLASLLSPSSRPG
jgi:hypothetical protein